MRLLDWQKRGYQALSRRRSGNSKRVVFIFGCQRSGTTLLLDVFKEDLRTAIFPEQSELSRPVGGRLRLKPVSEIRARIDELRVPLVVLKPIVESQNAPWLLEGLPGASAIWMYRGYESVAASDLELFGLGNGIRNLSLLLSNDPPNWRADVVPETTRRVLMNFFRPDMPPYDAAALFWWARNSLFFDVGLDERHDVLLCRYERLVSDPEETMRSVYRWIGVEWPTRSIIKRVHGDARGRVDSLPISSEVREVCEQLARRLDESFGAQRAARSSAGSTAT